MSSAIGHGIPESLTPDEKRLIDLYREITTQHIVRKFVLGTLAVSIGTISVFLSRGAEKAPESDADMPVNLEKAYKDIVEIQQLVKEGQDLDARNSRLRDEKAELLPQLIDKMVTNPSERDALKKVLAP